MKIPFGLGDTEGLSKEEIRKKRKLQEQLMAYGAVAGCIVLLIVVISIVVSIVTGGSKEQAKEKISKTETAKEQNAKTEERVTPADVPQSEEDTTVSAAEQVAAAALEEQIAEQAKAEEEEPEIDEAAILEGEIAGYIENMTLEEKVAGLFWVTPEQLLGGGYVTSAGSKVSDAVSEYPVGGFLFTESNMSDADQFLELVSNIRACCRYETFMAVSDEGGASSPFVKKGLVEEVTLSQPEIGESGGVAEAYSSGISYGTRLRAFGLNVNFAPMTDVTTLSSSGTAKRSFGDDLEDVTGLSKNQMQGMVDQAIYPVAKYFPGYGDVSSDGIRGRVASSRTMDDLKENECKVYEELIDSGIQMIMVSHVSMPKVDEADVPSCFSSVIVNDLLRNEMGFEGIILSDYMNKSAISKRYKQNTVAVQAIQAGCDMVVAPSNFKQQYQSLLDAVNAGTITEERIEESLYRIYRVKYKNLVIYE